MSLLTEQGTAWVCVRGGRCLNGLPGWTRHWVMAREVGKVSSSRCRNLRNQRETSFGMFECCNVLEAIDCERVLGFGCEDNGLIIGGAIDFRHVVYRCCMKL